MSIGIKRFLNNFDTEAKWIGELSIKWYSSNKYNNGSSSSSLTGSPSKLSAYSALSGGVDDAKDWFNKLSLSIVLRQLSAHLQCKAVHIR
jgi:hypothetical protein